MTTETTISIDERDLDDAALEALAEAYATPAPEQLRARLIGSIERECDTRRSFARVRRARIVGALAAGVTLVFAALFAREVEHGRERTGALTELSQQNAALAQQNAALATRLDEQGRTLAGLRDALDAQAQVLRLVGGPRMLTATLAPQKGVTGAGRVLVDATSGDAAIVLSGLFPVAEDQTYELWAIRGKKAPEPAGLIAVADARAGVIRVPSITRASEVTAFAVSIEPKGGSTSPTGPIVLVGSVSG